ncbi:MAG: S-formylglutathione hydrolase [Pseudomonadota bacterium]
MDVVSENRCFGGVQGVYTHEAASTRCAMTFALFLPPQAQHGKVPLLWYLSGLTCTHENAMTKAGAQAWASKYGLALAFPDTSPRGDGVADDDAYDLGQGAGFYVDATETPWAPHFQMWRYLTQDLTDLIFDRFPLDPERQAITGHSMGGHGALTIGLAEPARFRSISAFSPICNPSQSDWGRKQLTAYLGSDEALWSRHDASIQMRESGFDGPLLIDTGTDDQFLPLLRVDTMAQAIAARGQSAVFRMQPGYDHSYFFVASFMRDHIAFHAEALGA